MADELPLLDREDEKAAKWWYYLAFLGLDAPLVLTLWLWITAKTTTATVGAPVFLAAFCAVWSVYLADRLIDVRHCKDWNNATARLRFGKRFRVFFLVALAVCLAAGTAIVVSGELPQEVMIRGFKVAAAVLGYFGLFVAPPFFKKEKVRGKEFFVGLIFAGGIGAATGFSSDTLLFLILFNFAAAYNCLLIASRDFEADNANDPGGASQWWRSLRRDLNITGPLFTLASILFVFFTETNSLIILSCFAISFAMMAILHMRSEKLSGSDVRALADFCLLTPLIGIWFL